MKEIVLNHNQIALVDDDMFDTLLQWKWHYSPNGYAARQQQIGHGYYTRRFKKIYMHRVVAGTPDGMLTDHINGNKLDNRRINLRHVNDQQNNWNLGKNRQNTSGYIGVSHDSRDGGWEAYTSLNRQKIHIGYFSTAIDAAEARDSFVLCLKGEYARLNFPLS